MPVIRVCPYRFLPALAVLLLATSCQERFPLELAHPEESNELQVALLSSDEAILAQSTVDSTGLLARDEEEYPATFIFAGVQILDGSQSESFAYSRVLLNDRSRPVNVQGQFVGFVGLDIGIVRINGVDLEQRTRTFNLPEGTPPPPGPVNLGVYYDGASIVFQPGTDITFQASGRDSLPPVTIAVQTPDSVRVTSFDANSMISRSGDLEVRWSGQAGGEVTLLMSGETPEGLIPILRLHVADSAKPFSVPSKILRLLPEGVYSRFVFSLISINRLETQIAGYSDPVLVQAASIHHVIVTLQP